MKKFLFKMLGSNTGLSSKRIITFCAFILMAVGFIANLFFKLTIDPEIYDSMKWIVIGGLGFTASESFAGKTTKADIMPYVAPQPESMPTYPPALQYPPVYPPQYPPVYPPEK